MNCTCSDLLRLLRLSRRIGGVQGVYRLIKVTNPFFSLLFIIQVTNRVVFVSD